MLDIPPLKISDKKLVTVSAPSGAGKRTLIEYLLEKADCKLVVSATTRSPRPNEVDGREFHFISKDEFQKLIDAGELLEYNVYGDNYYGTPWSSIEEIVELESYPVLELELNGFRKVREKYPGPLCSVFILPPGETEEERLAILRSRLRGRKTETESQIDRRIEIARTEMACVTEFEHVIVNDNLEKAQKELLQIFKNFTGETSS